MRQFDDISIDVFINNICKVKNNTGGCVKLYNFQSKILDKVEQNDKTIILKSRQMGISTIFYLYSLYKAFTNNNYNACILNVNRRCSIYANKILVNVLDDLGISYDNISYDIHLPNGSKVIFGVNDELFEDYAKSGMDFIYLDEYAFAADYTMKRMYILSPFEIKKIVMASTPGLVNKEFFEIWQDNKNGLGDFYPIKLTWKDHPGRDKKWGDEQKNILGTKAFKQECDSKFVKRP